MRSRGGPPEASSNRALDCAAPPPTRSLVAGIDTVKALVAVGGHDAGGPPLGSERASLGSRTVPDREHASLGSRTVPNRGRFRWAYKARSLRRTQPAQRPLALLGLSAPEEPTLVGVGVSFERVRARCGCRSRIQENATLRKRDGGPGGHARSQPRQHPRGP